MWANDDVTQIIGASLPVSLRGQINDHSKITDGILLEWRKETYQLDYAELLKVCYSSSRLSIMTLHSHTENNLFLVKRLLNRTTDIRNVDPAAPRYTSLAWAAVLGHEEVFDFLLSKGHDDDELSKVCLVSYFVLGMLTSKFTPRTQRITPYSCFLPVYV